MTTIYVPVSYASRRVFHSNYTSPGYSGIGLYIQSEDPLMLTGPGEFKGSAFHIAQDFEGIESTTTPQNFYEHQPKILLVEMACQVSMPVPVSQPKA